MEVKALGPLTRDGLVWPDWMPQAGSTHVAMESTGEYWEPADNLTGDCRPASFPRSSSGRDGIGRAIAPKN
jgi:hypothetical protein